MRSFIVLALLVAAAVAAPPVSSGADKDAVVTRYESNNIGVDGYNFAVETSNGIAQQEQAILKNAGTDNEAIEVRGSYSYPGPDGVVYAVEYLANEGGFQPTGSHIPA